MRIIVVALASVFLVVPAARAQQGQAGVSYTLLSLSYPDQIPNGFGGWFSWDFTDPFTEPRLVVGLDTALNIFPEDHPIIGRQVQLLGGLRGGVRTERLAALGRVRPGLIRFSRRFLAPQTPCPAIDPPPEGCLTEERNFAVDVGVTFEVLATERAVLRFDAGNTLIRFERSGRDQVWTSNFQFAAGAGLRF